MYRTNLVLINDPNQCGNQPAYQPIMVDTSLARLVIIGVGSEYYNRYIPKDAHIFSDNMMVSVMDPDGAYPTPALAYRLNNTFIWTINGPHTGQWFFTFISGSPGAACSYRIYAQNYMNSRTDYDLFWSIAESVTDDGQGIQPIYSNRQ